MAETHAPTILNRQARFEYTFLETVVAGLVLMGTEIKSLRQGKVQLTDAWCFFRDGEAFIKDLYISPYEFGNIHNPPDPRRERKLLMKKREAEKLRTRVEEKGLSLIPVKLFFTDRGFAKIELALAKGKKTVDKRETIKERETEREMRRHQDD